MSEGVLPLAPKVVTVHVRIRAQSVPSLVPSVHPDAEGTYSFWRSQSQTRVVCLAGAER